MDNRVLLFASALFISADSAGARQVRSAFLISKSENKNQVHYGVHLDDRCEFTSGAPVFAYWRMLERGPNVTEPLLPREQRGYGIARQEVQGDTVRFTLRALPARPITIHISRTPDGTCTARAETIISGVVAKLFNVYISLGFLRVDHLLLTGWAATGQVVRERLTV